jgi:hypothetical protein
MTNREKEFIPCNHWKEWGGYLQDIIVTKPKLPKNIASVTSFVHFFYRAYMSSRKMHKNLGNEFEMGGGIFTFPLFIVLYEIPAIYL